LTQQHLGFLTIQHDQHGYSGGYLVTNSWGRPLEFRLSTAIQPNKVQHVLYGPTLRPYLCSELLGKTLVEKASTPVHLVITDCDAALDLRLHQDQPVAWLAPMDHSKLIAHETSIIAKTPSYALIAHTKYSGDIPIIRELLNRMEVSDLAEPFSRVKEALAEARKMGVLKAA
jgi:hypothetical protein